MTKNIKLKFGSLHPVRALLPFSSFRDQSKNNDCSVFRNLESCQKNPFRFQGAHCKLFGAKSTLLNFYYSFSASAEPAELLKMPLAYWPAVFESWGHQFFKSMKMLWRLSRQLLCSTTTSSRPKAPTTSAPPIWGVKLKMVNYFQASGSKRVTFRTCQISGCWQETDLGLRQQEPNESRSPESSWLTIVPLGSFTVPFEVSDFRGLEVLLWFSYSGLMILAKICPYSM